MSARNFGSSPMRNGSRCLYQSKEINMEEIQLIQGACAFDDRGAVGFVNEFRFEGVRRFYTVANHAVGFVRAWHGHKQEMKYCTVMRGVFLVCCIKIDEWERP